MDLPKKIWLPKEDNLSNIYFQPSSSASIKALTIVLIAIGLSQPKATLSSITVKTKVFIYNYVYFLALITSHYT